MDALIIVEVNVIINDLSGFFKGWNGIGLESFFFQMSKEAFHRSIVPAIASSGHGRSNGIILGQASIIVGGILVAMV